MLFLQDVDLPTGSVAWLVAASCFLLVATVICAVYVRSKNKETKLLHMCHICPLDVFQHFLVSGPSAADLRILPAMNLENALSGPLVTFTVQSPYLKKGKLTIRLPVLRTTPASCGNGEYDLDPLSHPAIQNQIQNLGLSGEVFYFRGVNEEGGHYFGFYAPDSPTLAKGVVTWKPGGMAEWD
jgi:hypothetical protein